MSAIVAIEALNGLITLAMNSTIMAEKISRVLAQAQKQNRPISDAEWADIVAQADASDKRLADAIKAAGG